MRTYTFRRTASGYRLAWAESAIMREGLIDFGPDDWPLIDRAVTAIVGLGYSEVL